MTLEELEAASNIRQKMIRLKNSCQSWNKYIEHLKVSDHAPSELPDLSEVPIDILLQFAEGVVAVMSARYEALNVEFKNL